MLSIALASSGKRVILIGADLRAPTVSSYMMVPTWPGLTDLLTGHIDSVQRVLQATDVAGLTVLPSGAMPLDSSPTELLESDRMQTVLEECADADYVVVDVPSVLSVADALVLAPLVDGVLFVAAARRTSPEMVELARVQLERIGANIIGGILVGARSLEGVNPSYYTSVYPGTETVRAAMARTKRTRPGPREEDAAGGDRARARPDTSPEGAASARHRPAVRPEERVDKVVSVPSHSDEAPVPTPQASTKTNDVPSERHPVEGQQMSAPPAQTYPGNRSAAPKQTTASSSHTGPTPDSTRPAPKEEARPSSEVAVQVPPPVQKAQAPRSSEATAQVAPPVHKEVTVQVPPPAQAQEAPPPSEVSPRVAPPVPKEKPLTPSQATPQIAAGEITSQVTPTSKEGGGATAAADVGAQVATPPQAAHKKKHARRRRPASREASQPSQSAVVPEDRTQDNAAPSLEDGSRSARASEDASPSDAEAPSG
jgi:capsular exopolysaccharide synthesis family protein